jgi:FeS assembly SUF system protein
MTVQTEHSGEISTVEQKLLEGQAIEEIRKCYDPEIPVNIYDLGLVYDVRVDANCEAHITMTLTSPHCPAAQTLPRDVETRVRLVHGIRNVSVTVVWEPAWNPSMMTEAAKLELGFL